MSPKLPRYTGKDILKKLKQWGFMKVRQSGSHAQFKNKKGVMATVPIHSNKTLHPKVLKSILKSASKLPQDLL